MYKKIICTTLTIVAILIGCKNEEPQKPQKQANTEFFGSIWEINYKVDYYSAVQPVKKSFTDTIKIYEDNLIYLLSKKLEIIGQGTWIPQYYDSLKVIQYSANDRTKFVSVEIIFNDNTLKLDKMPHYYDLFFNFGGYSADIIELTGRRISDF